MNKTLQRVCIFVAATLLFANCRKKEWDAYYGRPDNLQPPIYQQLESFGRFKSLLALIDKSGYKQTLGAAGYWTFFAPNDDAFQKFFKEKGIAGVDVLDSVTARAMVQYLLVYNAFKKDRLDDYQATANNAGWTPSAAFRRRTAYYTGFYNDIGLNNKSIVATANNRNSKGALDGNYISEDFNNKYLTYFTDDYFKANNLTAEDYRYFYPESEYKGFNVAQAAVLTQDIVAENGIIHEVDKVITPLQSIDEYIAAKPEYSSFRAILNRLYVNNMVQFIYNADATHRYQVLSGKGDSVFVKVYSNLLSYAPNNENFTKEEDNDGQKDCWTMFIPKNEAVDKYVKTVLCEYYPSLDQMPVDIIADFLNAHLFATAVWPTKFAVTRNKFSEPPRFDPYTDIFDRKVLSNGILYGTNKVEEPDVFSTVFSKAYLNPKYTMMTRLLNFTGLKLLVAKSNVPVNMLMIPDNVWAAAGYSYNVSKSQFEYTPAGGSATTNGVDDKLTRITKTCVFFDPFREMMEDLSGADIVRSGDAGTEGDYIKYNNNKIVTAGLQDAGLMANVDSVKTAVNGKVYFINQIPIYTDKPVGYHIKNLGTSTTSDYNYFWQYLSNSVAVYNSTTSDINGLTGFSTVFIPTNAAITQAVNDGLLPGTGTAPNKAPNFNPTDEPGKNLVRKFLQYHFLFGHTVVPDGISSGVFDSFYQNALGNNLKMTVVNSPDALSVIDNYNRAANVIVSKSNNLSSRCVIHLIDNYLKYNDN
ncbi:fasciclin domain-containing protein [Pinibacter aurantiacus]|uniref:Fasciclin domain-containing protein n=1 Tax=Pinibacter aurantiacus TaxID=2851599 RepID=A0A9E2S7L5_9BACT|nr:fasciclin domain-containing protein [Pinibacter aurantiacus]MBV4355989.1 fasciclin domain-containing protein [Pinibacter aurantiacus]